MNHLKIACLIIILFSRNSFAQEFSKVFGEISKAEIEMNTYQKDNTAEAVVLYDKGKSYFVRNENSYNVVFERSTRIKILSESGLDWAQVEIPFYQEGGIYEKVLKIEAITYNLENGSLKESKLDISNCHIEKINEFWNVKKFVLPNVKKGSIIEYRYTINSQYVFNLRDWEFQWKIPVMYSEYRAEMIPFYEYTYLLQGANQFDYQDSYVNKGITRQFGSVKFQNMIHIFVLKDVPAFNNEEFISSINDYIIKLDFQLSKIRYPDGTKVDIITTWPDLIKELSKNNEFGKYLRKSEKIASKIFDLELLQNKTSKEKFDYIVNYVKENFNWNSNKGKYASKSPNDFLNDKYGNCADINLFTIGALNAAGIKAYPILISTRDHGKIKYDYPFSHFFNYVLILANIDGTNVLSDATEILCSNFRIPERCINDKGLLIKKDTVDWINLTFSLDSKQKTNLFIEIDDSESAIKCKTKIIATEYHALDYRTTLGDSKSKILDFFNEKGYSVIDSSIRVNNQNDVKKDFELQFFAKCNVDIINNKAYINPFLNEIINDNPLNQATRTYPVDMVYPTKESYVSTIKVPEGYKVDYIPSSDKINNQLFVLNYQTQYDDEKITVIFNYYFKKPIYNPSDYKKIKYYFSQIVKKGNEKIVLSKIKDLN